MPFNEMDLVKNQWFNNNYDAWDADYVSDDDTANLIGEETEVH
nr:hypothetical protein [Rickettsia endosymbiont of Ixodes pacificus]